MSNPLMNFKMDVTNKVDSQKILKVVSKMAHLIQVGFPGGRTHIDTVHKTEDGKRYTTIEDGMDTAELAKILSYGAKGIPARPFLVEGINSKKDELLEELKKQSAAQLKTGNGNWKQVGAMAYRAVFDFMTSDYYKSTAPNSAAWIKEKGSDHPLIDGGDLRGALTFNIKEKE